MKKLCVYWSKLSAHIVLISCILMRYTNDTSESKINVVDIGSVLDIADETDRAIFC